MGDILNGLQLEDDECLVALDEGGTGWIIAQSETLKQADVLIEQTTDDNGFFDGWTRDLAVGVYKLKIQPWAHLESITGDFNTGVDVKRITPLWVAGPNMPDIRASLEQIKTTVSLDHAQRLAAHALTLSSS